MATNEKVPAMCESVSVVIEKVPVPPRYSVAPGVPPIWWTETRTRLESSPTRYVPGPAAAPTPIEIAYVGDSAINVSEVSPRATPTRPPAFHAAPSIVAVNDPFGCTGGMIRCMSGV